MIRVALRLMSPVAIAIVWGPAALLAATTALFWYTDLDQAAVRHFFSGDAAADIAARFPLGNQQPWKLLYDWGVYPALLLGCGGMIVSVVEFFRLRIKSCAIRPVFRAGADRRAGDIGQLRFEALLESAAPRHQAILGGRQSSRSAPRFCAGSAERCRRRRFVVSQRTRRDGLLPDGAGIRLLSPSAVAGCRISASWSGQRHTNWISSAWSQAATSQATCFGPAG